MGLDRAHRGAEFVGDLFVEQTAHHQNEDFPLSGRQTLDAGARDVDQLGSRSRNFASGDRALDGVEKLILGNGLGQKIFRPGLNGTDTCLNIAVSGYEDNRETASGCNQYSAAAPGRSTPPSAHREVYSQMRLRKDRPGVLVTIHGVPLDSRGL